MWEIILNRRKKMDSRYAAKMVGLSLLVSLILVQPIRGAEKSWVIKLATLAIGIVDIR